MNGFIAYIARREFDRADTSFTYVISQTTLTVEWPTKTTVSLF